MPAMPLRVRLLLWLVATVLTVASPPKDRPKDRPQYLQRDLQHPHDHPQDHPQDHPHDHLDNHVCGFVATPESRRVDEARSVGLAHTAARRLQQQHNQQQYSQRRQLHWEPCDELCVQCVEIVTRVHLVLADADNNSSNSILPHPTEAFARHLQGDADLTADAFSQPRDILNLFQDQVEILNRAFLQTPFYFTFDANATRTIAHTNWTCYGSEFRTPLQEELSSGDSTILDVFLVYQLADRRISGETSTSTMAMATFAGEQVERGDGVLMRYDVLAGGGHPTHDFGYILVHEVGHWLGLFHTFQQFNVDACFDPVGDLIEDTPLQNGDSKSSFPNCTLYLDHQNPLPDTCPNQEGVDAFFNFMNYVSTGLCWQQEGDFTCGQISRMHLHWQLFREHVSTCDNPEDEVELEIIILVDDDFQAENMIRLRDSSTGQAIFNSYRDFSSILSNRHDGKTIFFDLCLPRNGTYFLGILDRQQNGFSNGVVQVYRDRLLYARVEGNFGDAAVIEIMPNAQNLPWFFSSDEELEPPRATQQPQPPPQQPSIVPPSPPTSSPHSPDPVEEDPGIVGIVPSGAFWLGASGWPGALFSYSLVLLSSLSLLSS